jgi:hypothetical protein
MLICGQAMAQESIDSSIRKAKPFELGQAVLLLMPDRQQEVIDWDFRSESDIVWIDNGYVMERLANDNEIAIRRGLVRINVKGKTSTVLRQRKQELSWTVQFETTEPPKFGVAEVWLYPGTPKETCFGSLYEGCSFEVIPSLKIAGISWKEICKYNRGQEQLRGYILRHPQRADTQALVMNSGGSGGDSTSVMLRLKGSAKNLCVPK